MPQTAFTTQEIVERGQSLYDQQIRAEVEPKHKGEYLIVNVETGEYVVDPDDVAASKRAKAMFPDAPLYTIRVGHPTAYRIGGRFPVEHRA